MEPVGTTKACGEHQEGERPIGDEATGAGAPADGKDFTSLLPHARRYEGGGGKIRASTVAG